MPAGCEFICKNKNCKHNGSGFVMTAPWPMANIGLVITEDLKRGLTDKANYLKKCRDEGKKYACINLPNYEELPISAYRVQLWSPKGKIMWEYDVPCSDGDVDVAVQNFSFPEVCPKSQGELMTFKDCIREGINCPYCGEKMFQSRWFSIEN